MKEKTLIILDSFEYKRKESLLKETLSDVCEPVFYYTRYENKLIELFCKTKVVGGVLQHLAYWALSFYYSIRLVLGKKYQSYIFINPIVGIFFGMLTRLFFLKKRITIGGFLFENKKNKFYLYLRKAFVNFSYHNIDKIVVYGETEVPHYKTLFPKLAKKFAFVQYGKDYDYQEKKEFVYKRPFIASGGRSNRNFQVLCDAFDALGDPCVDCLIATRPECVSTSMEKSKVQFIYGITLNQFGSFIQRSKIFIVTLLDTNISAGHMAMMEAMAVGTPIIVSDIPAIRNYVDERSVFFFSPNSSLDLKEKIGYVLNGLNSAEVVDKVNYAKKLYETSYSFAALLKRMVLVSEKV